MKFRALINLSLYVSLSSITVAAQNTESSIVSTHDIISASTDVRIDWQHESIEGNIIDANSGFEGKYFRFKIEGEIVPGLTYSWRQRLNKSSNDDTFFDATDWLFLNWNYQRWEFNAGKEVVAIGGFEYDRNPIGLYSCSLFWQNISCFQLGGGVGYHLSDADKLTLQVAQSPFHTPLDRNLYAWSCLWTGQRNCWQTLWSANMLEYMPKHYISYLALGNRFAVGNFVLELDWINRAASHQQYLFRDCSLIAELAWQPQERWRIHTKFTYDVNQTHSGADLVINPGTELSMIGGGVEFYPLIKKRTSLMLHADLFYSWGRNSNSLDIMQNRSLMFSAGIHWKMSIFSLKSKS